jgi:hypothetical protein
MSRQKLGADCSLRHPFAGDVTLVLRTWLRTAVGQAADLSAVQSSSEMPFAMVRTSMAACRPDKTNTFHLAAVQRNFEEGHGPPSPCANELAGSGSLSLCRTSCGDEFSQNL